LNMPSSGFLYPPDVINKLAHGHVWSNGRLVGSSFGQKSIQIYHETLLRRLHS
jgi:hypothetical protein